MLFFRLMQSGIDNNGSYLPKNLHPQWTTEPSGSLDDSFAEAKLVMGGAVTEVLKKTGQHHWWHACSLTSADQHFAAQVVASVHIINAASSAGAAVQASSCPMLLHQLPHRCSAAVKLPCRHPR